MKLRIDKDDGFGSGWNFQWGWLPDRLDALRGALVSSNHVGSAAAKGR